MNMKKLNVSSIFASQLNNHALGLLRRGNFMDAEKCLNRALLLPAVMKKEATRTCWPHQQHSSEDYIYIEQEWQEQTHQQRSKSSSTHCHRTRFRVKVDNDHDHGEDMWVYCCDPIFIPISSSTPPDEWTIQRSILYNLGVVYMWLQEYDESNAYFSKALSFHIPPNHNFSQQIEEEEDDTTAAGWFQGPDEVMILHNLSYVNLTQGRYSEAFSNNRETLRLLLTSKGYYHPGDVATCLNSMGMTVMQKMKMVVRRRRQWLASSALKSSTCS